jgi:hypothetical protein
MNSSVAYHPHGERSYWVISIKAEGTKSRQGIVLIRRFTASRGTSVREIHRFPRTDVPSSQLRLREGDSHEQELLCSCSRAHHAPYFRWDLRVETCILEMRLSSPEYEGRTSCPRALLDYLPRHPVLQAAGFAFPGPAALFGSCFGKPGVFGPRHRGTS